ncbi:hypothetical protein BO94DRAFT_583722 [Aspergillus sclerotioniger CBS 115572]|uniref:Uncharacterized protein n=1 Tax=Aspergillus sclerotioniger CBS 115572 TaxID=1450535 RepID=A0A317X5G3_9EURO|nr:hypothetical protein BO94DRAFT_583722 [Aspergillus sclerotioniger CBS 115572]PWY91790.1 hypothetical protein BO94DRAFT_583722 [Aspergillus sclerotioniger CBS 115572]
MSDSQEIFERWERRLKYYLEENTNPDNGPIRAGFASGTIHVETSYNEVAGEIRPVRHDRLTLSRVWDGIDRPIYILITGAPEDDLQDLIFTYLRDIQEGFLPNNTFVQGAQLTGRNVICWRHSLTGARRPHASIIPGREDVDRRRFHQDDEEIHAILNDYREELGFGRVEPPCPDRMRPDDVYVEESPYRGHMRDAPSTSDSSGSIIVGIEDNGANDVANDVTNDVHAAPQDTSLPDTTSDDENVTPQDASSPDSVYHEGFPRTGPGNGLLNGNP